MLDLVVPTTRLHSTWLEAHDDWGPGVHEDGFGLHPADEVRSTDGFAAWVARLAYGPATFRWILADGEVAGGIALRHGPSDTVRQLGHVGYGIRPAFRRRGMATWALGRILEVARDCGLPRVLLVCETGNLASARTIEHHGGVLTPSPTPRTHHYWIATAG